ncbi:hypothetical protein KEJ27_09805 [Candidatus Bathyarchaeota archaeon]|nr:hypothetical protein [Candidatus Bathyarchaeota archaeon]
MSVIYDSRLEKSINRLRHMGLRCHILKQSEDLAFIFIPLEDVLKLIQKQITYPSCKVYFEEGLITIRVWRG